MTSDLGVGRSRGARKSVACKTVFWVGVLPFLLGLAFIYTLYKAGSFSLQQHSSRSLGEEYSAAKSSACPQPAACNCTAEIADPTDLKTLEGALIKSSLNKVLGAANSSDPQEQTVRINEDVLPSVFLFVGVLSGRGYRSVLLVVKARKDVRWHGQSPAV